MIQNKLGHFRITVVIHALMDPNLIFPAPRIDGKFTKFGNILAE